MSIFRKDKKTPSRDGLSIQDERKHLLSDQSDFYIREAYKTLRTNVSFALNNEEGCKIVAVTSAQACEGKSITAFNLAISTAMTGSKVLVIDCDLRRPKVSRLLQMRPKVGLSNLILNPKLLPEAILPTEVQNLDVILSGSVPPNPSELLGSQHMQQLLEELRNTYDYVFLDSPPVNVVTDTAVLAPRCDGVLLLVRANRSERGSVVHAVKQLEYSKAKILGFILNGVDMERIFYGRKKYAYRKYRYAGYGYEYEYGSSMPLAFAAELAEEAEAGGK